MEHCCDAPVKAKIELMEGFRYHLKHIGELTDDRNSRENIDFWSIINLLLDIFKVFIKELMATSIQISFGT